MTGGGSLTRRWAVLVALAAGLTALALLLILFASPARAASPNPDGCPDGFHFEPLSGVGCVQDQLPPDARYGYTGAAICSDPYIMVQAPGPNSFGRDPNVYYLIQCITPEEADQWAGQVPVPLGTGPLDDLAGMLVEGDPVLPDPEDSDIGGLAATAALMVSAAGAALLTGSALGTAAKGATAVGAAGAGGPGSTGLIGGGGEASAALGVAPSGEPVATVFELPLQVAGGLTTSAGSGLPLPRAELVSAGLSIARSVQRLTDEPDATGYSSGDLVQLLGDAASIGALATILAPATGLVSLAGTGAATATDAQAGKVLDRLRQGFGQLGYMQGVLDENISALDGQLAGLDGAPRGGSPAALRSPGDPAALSDEDLRELRAAWAAHTDVLFDALIEAQADMGDLDNRRRNLAHQIDAVNDLLARLDESGRASVPPHLGDTLSYGLGWFRAGDPALMVAALRESRAQARAAGMAEVLRSSPAMARASAIVAASMAGAPGQTAGAGPGTQPAGKGKAAGAGKGSASTGRPRSLRFSQWARANRFEGGRMGVLQALAGLERWSGFYDALTGTLQRRITTLREQAYAAGATRRSLSSEMQHRTLEAER